jgi:hypothetical protein
MPSTVSNSVAGPQPTADADDEGEAAEDERKDAAPAEEDGAGPLEDVAASPLDDTATLLGGTPELGHDAAALADVETVALTEEETPGFHDEESPPLVTASSDVAAPEEGSSNDVAPEPSDVAPGPRELERTYPDVAVPCDVTESWELGARPASNPASAGEPSTSSSSPGPGTQPAITTRSTALATTRT